MHIWNNLSKVMLHKVMSEYIKITWKVHIIFALLRKEIIKMFTVQFWGLTGIKYINPCLDGWQIMSA